MQRLRIPPAPTQQGFAPVGKFCSDPIYSSRHGNLPWNLQLCHLIPLLFPSLSWALKGPIGDDGNTLMESLRGFTSINRVQGSLVSPSSASDKRIVMIHSGRSEHPSKVPTAITEFNRIVRKPPALVASGGLRCHVALLLQNLGSLCLIFCHLGKQPRGFYRSLLGTGESGKQMVKNVMKWTHFNWWWYWLPPSCNGPMNCLKQRRIFCSNVSIFSVFIHKYKWHTSLPWRHSGRWAIEPQEEACKYITGKCLVYFPCRVQWTVMSQWILRLVNRRQVAPRSTTFLFTLAFSVIMYSPKKRTSAWITISITACLHTDPISTYASCFCTSTIQTLLLQIFTLPYSDLTSLKHYYIMYDIKYYLKLVLLSPRNYSPVVLSLPKTHLLLILPLFWHYLKWLMARFTTQWTSYSLPPTG